MIFTEHLKTKKKISFISLQLIFSCYYCSIDLKRQSEYSGLCLGLSSLVTINPREKNTTGAAQLLRKSRYCAFGYCSHVFCGWIFRLGNFAQSTCNKHWV